jgi:hypothetical protein
MPRLPTRLICLASLALASCVVSFVSSNSPPAGENASAAEPVAKKADKAATKKPEKPASKPAAPRKKRMNEVEYPPMLPGGAASVTETSPEFLVRPESMSSEVEVAKEVPTVDLAYFPGQNYVGDPWSNWGDSVTIGDKYYASIGDHAAPDGNAFIYEYDPAQKTFRKIFEVRETLKVPEGMYTPGKIHSRLDVGSDGKIYFSTHRGSPKMAADKYGYKGDPIFRVDPKTAKAEVVAEFGVPKHSIPTSVLDPDRLIFYGGTAAGPDAATQGIQFVAYDCKNGKVLQTNADGPPRYLMFAKSTGRVYYVPASNDAGNLVRFDPAVGGLPVPIDAVLGVRAATQETPQGIIYTASTGQGKAEAMIWAFDTKTEKVEQLGDGAVGTQAYIASMDVDPTGRYIYYVPGAHGGSEQDGSAVIQFDVQTKRKKVIAFLNKPFEKKYGVTLKGTYSTALDPKGEKLFITWNASRDTTPWDCNALTVVHIPASERKP